MGVRSQVVLINGWKSNGTWTPNEDESEALDELDTLWFDRMSSGDILIVGTRIADCSGYDFDSVLVDVSGDLLNLDVPVPSVGPVSAWVRGIFFVGHWA
jgi:hypothetical protein